MAGDWSRDGRDKIKKQVQTMNVVNTELFEKRKFLTNAGTETYLCFQQGFDLREFCAFVIHEDDSEWAKLVQNYLSPIFKIASENGYGLMLDTLVWRAQPDFLKKLGRPERDLEFINKRAVQITRKTVEQWRKSNNYDQDSFPVLIVADTGPKGDGYQIDATPITADEAYAYHRAQLEALADEDIDLVTALTMTTVQESIGMVKVASDLNLPIIVSPTVETNGKLPDETPLGDFIQQVDEATNSTPLFYMVNCAHPTHLMSTLENALENNERWLSRFRGFRANASIKSHEELDNSTELDRGDLKQLGEQMKNMQVKFNLYIIGGCCGTDHEHLAFMI